MSLLTDGGVRSCAVRLFPRVSIVLNLHGNSGCICEAVRVYAVELRFGHEISDMRVAVQASLYWLDINVPFYIVDIGLIVEDNVRDSVNNAFAYLGLAHGR